MTKIAGGKVAGPITETWPVAQGSLRGTIYYETYDSPLAGGVRLGRHHEIQPGATQPTVAEDGLRQRLPHGERRRLDARRGRRRCSRARATT